MTERRTQVVDCLRRGLTRGEISLELGLTPHSVAYQIGRLREVHGLGGLEALVYGQAGRPVPAGISDRLREVADLVAQGLTNREIAAELGVSVNTVRTHVQRLQGVLDAPNRVVIAVRWVELRRAMGSGV